MVGRKPFSDHSYIPQSSFICKTLYVNILKNPAAARYGIVSNFFIFTMAMSVDHVIIKTAEIISLVSNKPPTNKKKGKGSTKCFDFVFRYNCLLALLAIFKKIYYTKAFQG